MGERFLARFIINYSCCRAVWSSLPLSDVDDDNNDDVAAGGTPAAIGTWAKAEAVDAPAIFSDAGAYTWISRPPRLGG